MNFQVSSKDTITLGINREVYRQDFRYKPVQSHSQTGGNIALNHQFSPRVSGSIAYTRSVTGDQVRAALSNTLSNGDIVSFEARQQRGKHGLSNDNSV